MKNLNKALALLVVFAMMISTVAFAASFSDVADDASYAEAVGVGVAFGWFKGYEDGTFQPAGDITRGEFAAIVVRMLGQEGQQAAAAAATPFKDVPASHWAAGYINMASNQGIINGYGDGTFGPEDKVNYEQAIKMLVCALGYAPVVDAAQYPVSFMTKAGELGITNAKTKGAIGAAANRGTIAQLAFNALDIPLMYQTGYGQWIDYKPQDGTNDTERKTILSEKMSAVKLQAVVNSSKTVGTNVKTDTVNVTVSKNYKTKWAADFVAGRSYDLEVGTSNAASFVGSKAIIYAIFDETGVEDTYITYIAKDVSKSTLTLDSSMIEDVDDGIVTYREKPEDRTAKTFSVADDANVYYNGAQADAAHQIAFLNSDTFYGDVTFDLLENGDYDYDTVTIRNFTNIVVESVSTRSYKVSAKNIAQSISFDPDDTGVKATLYDANGNQMDFADLKEWDVISCLISEYNGKTTVTATLVDNNVTGSVTSISSANDVKEVKYKIGGTDYKLDYNSLTMSDIALGDSGTFYLDALDRIVYYDTTAALNSNFAYVMDIGTSAGVSSRTELSLYFSSGEAKDVKTADKVKVDGITGIASADLADATITVDPVALSNLIAKHGTEPYEVTDGMVTGVDGIAVGDFFSYTLNAQGEITAIDRATNRAAKGVFTQYTAGQTTYTYNETSERLTSGGSASFEIDDKTVILICPGGTDEDDYELWSIANLADEDVLPNAIAYNVDVDTKIAGAVVVYTTPAPSTSAKFAIVKGTGKTENAKGENVLEAALLRNGEIGSYLTTDEDLNMPQGSVAIPGMSGDAIKNWNIMARPRTGYTEISTTIDAVGPTVTYTGGRVISVKGTNVDYVSFTQGDSALYGGTFNPTAVDSVSVKGEVNIYVYDVTRTISSRVTIDDLSYVDVHRATASEANTYEGYEEGQVVYDSFDAKSKVKNVEFFARLENGKVTDLVFFVYDAVKAAI